MSHKSDAVPLVGAKNLLVHAKDGVVSLYVDLAKDFGMSSTGKTVVIASSCGNKPLGSSGAFLGVNFYTKSLAERDLSEASITSLSTADFQPVGEGMEWRIEPKSTSEDGCFLCVRMDLGSSKGRAAGSGKSILLATSGGNKPVGSTHIQCGINCYHAIQVPFDASRLSEEVGSSALKPGEERKTSNGYTLSYRSLNEAVVECDVDTLELNNTISAEESNGKTSSALTLTGCMFGTVSVMCTIAAVKNKRARTQSTAESNNSTTSASDAADTGSGDEDGKGGFVPAGTEGGDETSKLASIRNLLATCTPVSGGGAEGSDTAYRVRLRFDPTMEFGRSGTGKSISVATSAGFQNMACARAAGAMHPSPICRVNFNAYKPAPAITPEDVNAVVEQFLSGKKHDELEQMPFSKVLANAVEHFGLTEKSENVIREIVKDAAKAFLNKSRANK